MAQPIVSGVPFQKWDVNGGRSAPVEFFKIGEEFLIRFPDIADFFISRNREVTVKCVPALGSDDLWRGVYEQQIQPLLVSLRGEQIFHGAAIAVGDRAIAFLGASGRGKSTLTTAFARRGHPFLSDDCLHLDLSGPEVRVHPDADHVRLWEDSAAAFGGQAAYVSGSLKPRLVAGDALPYCDHPLPLARVYVLAEGEAEAPRIEPISPSQQLIGWTANAFVLDIKNPEVLRRNLVACARLVREVPMRRLDYPRRYDALDAVVDAVLADAAA